MSQNNNFACCVQDKKDYWPCIVQQSVNAGPRKLGVKTAGPSADYRPH